MNLDLPRNVGRNDKNIRIAVGAVVIIIGLLFAHSFWLTLLGAVILATGVFSFCGLYQLLGMNTATAAEQVAASDDLSERATENFEDFKEEAIETAQELKEKAEVVAQDVKQETGEFIDDAKQKTGEFIDEAKEKIDEAKDSMNKK